MAREQKIEIIAEIGQNHNGNIKLAKKLIHCAKENGADVAKFQVFDTDKLFGKKNNPWYEYNLRSQLSRKDVLELAKECKRADIEFMASVFDIERIEWLEEAQVKRYKIASRSIKDLELLKKIKETGKPIIVSLGQWHEDKFPRIASCGFIYFLYCVSKYPAKLEDLKFNSVDFNKYSGFSDHTVGTTASLIALSRGAKIIEKHFTLDKKMHGPDHSGSMTPKELKQINEFRLELKSCL